MKKMKHGLSCRTARLTLKYVLMTKLAIILIVGFTIPSFANSYGQNDISLRLKKVPLREALKAIENQGFYRFVYKTRLLPKDEKVTIDVQDAPLHDVMAAILQNSGLTYRRVSDKLVVIIESGSIKDNETIGITVSGKITDDAGAAVSGASIQEKGTNNGTSSANDGSFSITVTNGDAVLLISSIGFVTQEVPVKNKTSIPVVLQRGNSELENVVVIGYGTQRKGDVTSSISSIKAENFVKAPVRNIGQLIQGKAAGVTIVSSSGDPTSGVGILLRGNTTILGANTNPLILIDGVPGDFNTVAPEDIESVDILKDGSAAAIYGIRATNGVILITTKRFKSGMMNTLEYSTQLSTQSIARKIDMLTAQDYRDQIAAGIRSASWDNGADTDWFKEATNKNPFSQLHNITWRGGNATTNYLVNGNFRQFNGIMKKSDNQTFSGRAEIQHNMLQNKVKFTLGLIGRQNKYTTTGDGYSFNGWTYRQTMIQNPTSPTMKDGAWFQENIFDYDNPLARLYESDGRNKSQYTRYNARVDIKPVNGLTLSMNTAFGKYNESRGYSETKQHVSTIKDGRNGYASAGATESIDRFLELTADYSRVFGDHRFSVVAGYGYQENERFESWLQNWDFPTDVFGYSNISLGKALQEGKATMGGSRSESNLISFFGRTTYSFADKYLLLASLRYEAANQLYGAEKPWGAFPAVSVGWKISQEDFMRDLHFIDNLKLRAGYGVTGNPPNSNFLGVALLNYADYYLINGNWIRTLTPYQNPNPYLRWEEKKELNIGLDFAVLNNRVYGSIDFYNRRIDGLLYDYQVPSPPNLYTSTRANVGVMENKGLEIDLSTVPVQSKDFSWTTQFLYSTNENRLVKLSNDLYSLSSNYFTTGSTGVPIQTFTHIVEIGKKVGDFYGYKVIDMSDDGYWIYADKDGKPVPYNQFNRGFDDKQVLGNGVPKWHLGWNNNLRYKNFDMGITMRGSFGFQILNFQRMYYENTGDDRYNRMKSAYDKIYGKAVLNKNVPLEFNSHYVEDGDFWKIDNISLGYTVSLPAAAKKYVQAARVFVSSLNTFIITGYNGIDPEVNWSGLNPGNDDRDKYPTVRTFTLGLNVTF